MVVGLPELPWYSPNLILSPLKQAWFATLQQFISPRMSNEVFFTVWHFSLNQFSVLIRIPLQTDVHSEKFFCTPYLKTRNWLLSFEPPTIRLCLILGSDLNSNSIYRRYALVVVTVQVI